MIDQLHYTWASRGVEGASKLQIVALSAGLSNENSLLAQALRLCNFGPPKVGARYARAFGWVDANGYRFAFSKVHLPEDQIGHPGNFAAHILVAPTREMPAPQLLASMESSLWWHGLSSDPTIGNLPPAHLEVATLSPSVVSDSTVNTLARLLSQPTQVEAQIDDQAFINDIIAIAGLVPEVLESTSFSTGEGDTTRGWFKIVGVQDPLIAEPEPRFLWAAEHLIERRPPAVALRAELARSSEEGRSFERAIDAALAGARLARQTGSHAEPLDVNDLIAACAIEGSFEELARTTDLSRSIALTLSSSDEFAAASKRWGAALSSRDWATIAGQIPDPSGAGTALRLAERLGSVDQRLLDAWASRYIETGIGGLNPGSTEAQDLLKRMLEGVSAIEAQNRIIANLSKRSIAHLIQSRRVPSSTRLRIWRQAEEAFRPRFAEIAGASDLLSLAFRTDPGLLLRVCSRSSKAETKQLLRLAITEAPSRVWSTDQRRLLHLLRAVEADLAVKPPNDEVSALPAHRDQGFFGWSSLRRPRRK